MAADDDGIWYNHFLGFTPSDEDGSKFSPFAQQALVRLVREQLKQNLDDAVHEVKRLTSDQAYVLEHLAKAVQS